MQHSKLKQTRVARAVMGSTVIEAERAGRKFVAVYGKSAVTIKVGERTETFIAACHAVFMHAFPTKRAYRDRDCYKAFMAAVRTASNNGTAYAYVRRIAVAVYGGLLDKDGNIRAPGAGKGSGMTLGRWNAAMKAKVDALSEYVTESVPKADIEPAAMEMVAAMVQRVNELAELMATFDAYVASEAEAVEATKNIAARKVA